MICGVKDPRSPSENLTLDTATFEQKMVDIEQGANIVEVLCEDLLKDQSVEKNKVILGGKAKA